MFICKIVQLQKLTFKISKRLSHLKSLIEKTASSAVRHEVTRDVCVGKTSRFQKTRFN